MHGQGPAPQNKVEGIKVIFLDIDGVLNSYATLPESEKGKMISLHKPLVDRLLHIVKRTGAKIVVSSSWRKSEWRLKEIRDAGIEYIGVTPCRPRPAGASMEWCERGKEIWVWINRHRKKNVVRYCILDDDSDMLPYQKHFKTSMFEGGLTEEIAERVIEYLNA